MKKKAIVVHSGGMDSSLCLALAVRDFGAEDVLSLSFTYGQRHSVELEASAKISAYFKVDHVVLDLSVLQKITTSALMNATQKIEKTDVPNTLVSGRNGLMARVAGIHADSLGAEVIYLGVMELEEANSGYRDCSRRYMDLIQEALRLDFNNPQFEIRTPLVKMTKSETMKLGLSLGVLSYLLEETVTCYEGIPKAGCGKCPACELKTQGLKDFLLSHPEVQFSYKDSIKV